MTDISQFRLLRMGRVTVARLNWSWEFDAWKSNKVTKLFTSRAAAKVKSVQDQMPCKKCSVFCIMLCCCVCYSYFMTYMLMQDRYTTPS